MALVKDYQAERMTVDSDSLIAMYVRKYHAAYEKDHAVYDDCFWMAVHRPLFPLF